MTHNKRVLGEKRRRTQLLACAVTAWILACAHPEQDFDTGAESRSSGATSRGGATTGGRGGTGGSPAMAGSTARGGSATVTGGRGGAAGSTVESDGGTPSDGGVGTSSDAAGSAGEDTGAAGSGPLPSSGDCAASPTARVQYKVLRSDSVIQFQLRFYNEGVAPLALDQYEFDYYLSNEEDSAWNAFVDDARTDGGADGYIALQGATTVTSMPFVPAAAGATHVVRITIDSTTLLEPEDEGLMTIRLEPTIYDPPHQVQTDDYSFDATKTELGDWDRVAVTATGELVWGCVP